jgi:hypothetical protein
MSAKHIEIVFLHHAHPDDLKIITPASAGTPGLVRLLKAKKGTQLGQDPPCHQLLSHNGGGFIGYISEGQPLAPYHDTYWLEEETHEPGQTQNH